MWSSPRRNFQEHDLACLNGQQNSLGQSPPDYWQGLFREPSGLTSVPYASKQTARISLMLDNPLIRSCAALKRTLRAQSG